MIWKLKYRGCGVWAVKKGMLNGLKKIPGEPVAKYLKRKKTALNGTAHQLRQTNIGMGRVSKASATLIHQHKDQHPSEPTLKRFERGECYSGNTFLSSVCAVIAKS